MKSPEKILRLFLIEDNPDDIAVVQQLIQTSKQHIVLDSSRRLKQGIEKILENPYDLLLLDLSLPDGHGLDALAQLKAKGVRIPIVILTSTNDRVVASIAIRQGAQDYIVKENITAPNLLRSIHYAMERKAVENALETERANFHSIVEMVNEGILVIGPDSRVQFANRTAEQFLRAERGRLRGKPCPFQIAKDETCEIEILRVGCGAGIGQCHTIPTDWQGKDARLIIIRDITDERAAEQMKESFLQNVSHELRTPLTSIRESISQVTEGLHGAVNEKQAHFLTLCLRNVDYLKRTVDDLLDISKLEAGQIDMIQFRFDFSGLVRTIVQSFQSAADSKDLKLDCSVPECPVFVHADRDKLTHVLMNLMGNALKFTDEGRIAVTVSRQGKNLECCVTDTGIGIAASDLPHIFDKFAQFGKLSPAQEKGTGLGLAISKALVECHGGNIRAESTQNEGSRFCFTLPADDKKPARDQ